ncbi:MAG: hypothetical protein Q7T89_09260 [Anaerolineales bacterium]|nr:hypothetical protein [Anaerolineales bacterium]
MKKILPLLLLAAIFLQACSNSTLPTAAVNTAVPIAVSSEAALVTPESVPSEVATVTQPVIAPVAHVTIPSAGTSDRATAHDNENSLYFDTKKVKTGDEFYKNRFERPFTSVDMAYLPDLDIVNFSITSDENFFYVKISMVDLDTATQSLTGSYGVEIDRNADGRAEILLVTRPPYSTEFSADNVAAYLDINGDVGGAIINRPDDYASDGFETTIFDLSQGIYPEGDPDFVWVRQTTDSDLPAVEIAFAKWMFEDGKVSFMWSVLTDDAAIDPATLYYHDHYTAEEAGAPNTDDPNYPIKALAAMDNTCRVPLGFQAVGSEPLGCYVSGGEAEAKATPTPDSTCGQFIELCSKVK